MGSRRMPSWRAGGGSRGPNGAMESVVLASAAEAEIGGQIAGAGFAFRMRGPGDQGATLRDAAPGRPPSAGDDLRHLRAAPASPCPASSPASAGRSRSPAPWPAYAGAEGRDSGGQVGGGRDEQPDQAAGALQRGALATVMHARGTSSLAGSGRRDRGVLPCPRGQIPGGSRDRAAGEAPAEG